MDNMEEFDRLAKLPLVPLVVTPDGRVWQDSTPIMEKLECSVPEPFAHPNDTFLRFISTLLEEWSDEWLNKIMFYYRWARPADQHAAAHRIAQEMMGHTSEDMGQGVQDEVESWTY